MSELLDLNLVDASKALKNKKISSLELTKAYLKSISDTSSLGAYLEIVEDKAISMAKESDKKCYIFKKTKSVLPSLVIRFKR